MTTSAPRIEARSVTGAAARPTTWLPSIRRRLVTALVRRVDLPAMAGLPAGQPAGSITTGPADGRDATVAAASMTVLLKSC